MSRWKKWRRAGGNQALYQYVVAAISTIWNKMTEVKAYQKNIETNDERISGNE